MNRPALEKVLLLVMGGSLLVIGWVVGVVTPAAHDSSTVTVSQAARTVHGQAKTVTVVRIKAETTTRTRTVKVNVVHVRTKFHTLTVTTAATTHSAVGASGSGGSGSNCTPGYSPCLPNHGYADYDCGAGSGNGPYYTTPGVTYRVTGSDPYGLDADGDGYGC